MSKPLSFCLMIFAMILCPLRLMAQPLADRIPADALFYIGWSGTDALKPQYEVSHLKPVLEASTIPEFLQKQLPELLRSSGGANSRAADIAAIVQVASTASRYPAGVYVGPFDISDPRLPKPSIAIFCDCGADSAALSSQLVSLWTQLPPDFPKYQINTTSTGLVILIGEPDLTGPKLSDQPDFQKAAAAYRGNSALFAYADLQGLVAQIDRVAAAKKDDSDSAKWPALRDALGLKSFRQLVFSAGFDGPNWRLRTMVRVQDASHAPLYGIMAGKSFDRQLLKDVPESATWFSAEHFDVAALLNIVENAAKATQKDQDLNNTYDRFYEKTGAHLKEDFLSTLGDDWVIYTSPNVGGSSWMGMTLVNKLKNAQLLSATITKFEDLAPGGHDSSTRPAPRSGPFDMRIKKTKFGELEVHYVNIFMLNPSWAVTNGRLYFGMMPQGIAAAANQTTQARSILDSDNFQAIVKTFSQQNIIAMQYLDLPKIAPEGYALLNQIISMVNTLGKVNVPPTILPPLYQVLPHLNASSSVSWADGNGFYMDSRSPFAGSSLLALQQSGAVYFSPIAASIMLPSLGRSRELSGRSADAANLKGISTSCAVWGNENNDNMPEHIGDLIVTQQVSPKSFISKRGKGKELPITREMIDKAVSNLSKTSKYDPEIARLVDENSDYVYIGKGTRNTTDSSIVLMYEKPGLSRDGFNVSFYDAHVEWVRFTTPQALAELFKATNDYRKSLKLDPIDTDELFRKATGGK